MIEIRFSKVTQVRQGLGKQSCLGLVTLCIHKVCFYTHTHTHTHTHTGLLGESSVCFFTHPPSQHASSGELSLFIRSSHDWKIHTYMVYKQVTGSWLPGFNMDSRALLFVGIHTNSAWGKPVPSIHHSTFLLWWDCRKTFGMNLN